MKFAKEDLLRLAEHIINKADSENEMVPLVDFTEIINELSRVLHPGIVFNREWVAELMLSGDLVPYRDYYSDDKRLFVGLPKRKATSESYYPHFN